MPHTTRKKKKPKFEKRIELIDSDGWTHVTRGGKREPSAVEERRFKELTSGPGSVQTSDLTMEALLALHGQVQDLWRASRCCQELVAVIRDVILASESLKVENCMCTGLGSVSSSGSFVSKAKSMWQLAAFESVMEVLQIKHAINAVYLQDPRFNDLDKDFFTNGRGFNVLQDPEAIQHMNTNTFFFAPCNEFTLLQRAFEVASPALFLGNDISDHLLHVTTPSETTSPLENLLLGSKAHKVLHQQQLPLSTPLQLGTLYWRTREIESRDVEPATQAAPLETQEGSPSRGTTV